MYILSVAKDPNSLVTMNVPPFIIECDSVKVQALLIKTIESFMYIEPPYNA